MCASTNLRRLGESELNRRGAGKHTRRREGGDGGGEKARKTQGDKTSWWGGGQRENSKQGSVRGCHASAGGEEERCRIDEY